MVQHRAIPVLDVGYVKLIETWGRGKADIKEAGIIEAARQSTQGSFRGWKKDESLLRFLFTQDPPHAGPFEFAGMVIEVQAPIFVFREWQRHRTQSYNEMSARYAPLPTYLYYPTEDRCIVEPGKNTQANPAAGTTTATRDEVRAWLHRLDQVYQEAMSVYHDGLEVGIPKEVARCVMPVGHYSRMRASANLRNWLAFLTLRYHPDAQWEIQQFAEAVAQLVSEQFPHTWALFEENRNDRGSK